MPQYDRDIAHEATSNKLEMESARLEIRDIKLQGWFFRWRGRLRKSGANWGLQALARSDPGMFSFRMASHSPFRLGKADGEQLKITALLRSAACLISL